MAGRSSNGLDTAFLDAVKSAFDEEGIRTIPGLSFKGRNFPSHKALAYVHENFDGRGAPRVLARRVYDHLQKLYGAEYREGKGINV